MLSESCVHISDSGSLDELYNAVDECGQSLVEVREKVSTYLGNVLSQLQKQLEELKKAKDKAERAYSNARDKLSKCEESQRWDKKDKCYRPSCDFERSREAQTHRNYEVCRQNYENGQRILNDCQQHINQYRLQDEKLLTRLANDHTKAAKVKLKDISNAAGQYTSASTSTNTSMVQGMVPGGGSKAEKFRKTGEGLNKRMQNRNNPNEKAVQGMVFGDSSKAEKFRKAGEGLNKRMQNNNSNEKAGAVSVLGEKNGVLYTKNSKGNINKKVVGESNVNERLQNLKYRDGSR